MIKKTIALSMGEALEYIKDDEKKAFIKNYTKLDENKAKELREKIIQLNLIKLNEKNISKLIDILPGDKDEMSKVLSDAHLDEDETNTILQTIKEYK